MPNWGDILTEIETEHKKAAIAINSIRRKYLKELREYTGRNVIAYYSGWLSKPGIYGTFINDEDKNGFMMAVHRLDRKDGLDLILHTEGGGVAAAESIVNYLRQMFDINIRAIIPQIAMSAGTMLACACKSIVMGKQSNLGPIDPHLGGIPAKGVLDEFEKAKKEIKKNPELIHLWSLIIGQYKPTFLSQCANAVARSEIFVANELERAMFAKHPEEKRKALAKEIVKKLTDYPGNKGHDKHIHMSECIEMGLVVEKLEADSTLQDLVLSVHHCFMHTLMNTSAYKIIENDLGNALVKQQMK